MRNVSTLLRPTMLSAALFIFVLGISAANVQAATITVTGNGDAVAADGQCTLREAMTAANTDAAVSDCPAGSGLDTVDFSVTGEIVLLSELPAINSNVIISVVMTFIIQSQQLHVHDCVNDIVLRSCTHVCNVCDV